MQASLEIKKDQINEDVLNKHKKEVKELRSEILKQTIKPDLLELQKDILTKKLNEFKNKTWDQLKNDNTWTLTIQSTLKALGYYENGKIDALYGAKTIDAIKKFQKDVGFTGIDLDGLAGTKTITKLIEKFIENLQKTQFEKLTNLDWKKWLDTWVNVTPERKDTHGNTIKTAVSLDNIPNKDKGYKRDTKEVYIFRKDGKMYKFFGNGRAWIYSPEKKLFTNMKNSTDLINEISKTPATKIEKIKIPVAKPDTAKIDSTKVVIQTPVDTSKINIPTDTTKINAPIDSTTVNIPVDSNKINSPFIGAMPYDSSKVNQPIDLTKIVEETKETEKTDSEILKGQFEFSWFSADTISITGDKALITDTKQNLEIEFDYKNRIFSNPKLKAGDEKYNLRLTENSKKITVVPDTLKIITTIKEYVKNPVIIDNQEISLKKRLDFTQNPSAIVFCWEDGTKETFQVRFSNLGELQQVETSYKGKVYLVGVTEKKQIKLTPKIEEKIEKETKTTIDSTTVTPVITPEVKPAVTDTSVNKSVITPEVKDESAEKLKDLNTKLDAKIDEISKLLNWIGSKDTETLIKESNEIEKQYIEILNKLDKKDKEKITSYITEIGNKNQTIDGVEEKYKSAVEAWVKISKLYMQEWRNQYLYIKLNTDWSVNIAESYWLINKYIENIEINKRLQN